MALGIYTNIPVESCTSTTSTSTSSPQAITQYDFDKLKVSLRIRKTMQRCQIAVLCGSVIKQIRTGINEFVYVNKPLLLNQVAKLSSIV